MRHSRWGLRIRTSKVFVFRNWKAWIFQRESDILLHFERISKRWIDLLLEVVELCKSLCPCNRKIVNRRFFPRIFFLLNILYWFKLMRFVSMLNPFNEKSMLVPVAIHLSKCYNRTIHFYRTNSNVQLHNHTILFKISIVKNIFIVTNHYYTTLINYSIYILFTCNNNCICLIIV